MIFTQQPKLIKYIGKLQVNIGRELGQEYDLHTAAKTHKIYWKTSSSIAKLA